MRKTLLTYALLGALLPACDLLSPRATPSLSQTPAPTIQLPTPFSPSPTAATPTAPLATSPDIQPFAELPKLPDAAASDWGQAFAESFGAQMVAYQSPSSLDAVRDFYLQALSGQGWRLRQALRGETLLLSTPLQTLILDFQRQDAWLGLFALGEMPLFSGPEGPGTLVMAALGHDGAELGFLLASMLAPGLDLSSPSEDEARPRALEYSTDLLRLRVPSTWFPTRQLMWSFETDVDGPAIHPFEMPRSCALDDETCLVNFMILSGSQFLSPVTLRAYTVQAGVSLDVFEASRWAELNEKAGTPLESFGNVFRPEDMAEAGSLESLEMRSFALADGTPAIQRLFRWRQTGLSTPLASSHTLFTSAGYVIELRTDFTLEEWARFGPTMQSVIQTIENAP